VRGSGIKGQKIWTLLKRVSEIFGLDAPRKSNPKSFESGCSLGHNKIVDTSNLRLN